MSQVRANLRTAFRWVDGHADLWAVFADPAVLAELGPALAEPFAGEHVSAVVAVESRGLVVGTLAAVALDARFVAVRKPGGLLPGHKLVRTTEPDYRGNVAELRLQADRLGPDDRVLLVDDWAETGSQLRAAAQLVRDTGAEIIGTSVLVNELPRPLSHELEPIRWLLTTDELHQPTF